MKIINNGPANPQPKPTAWTKTSDKSPAFYRPIVVRRVAGSDNSWPSMPRGECFIATRVGENTYLVFGISKTPGFSGEFVRAAPLKGEKCCLQWRDATDEDEIRTSIALID